MIGFAEGIVRESNPSSIPEPKGLLTHLRTWQSPGWMKTHTGSHFEWIQSKDTAQMSQQENLTTY